MTRNARIEQNISSLAPEADVRSGDKKAPHCDCGARLRYACSVFFSQHDRQNARDDRFSICVLDIRLLIQVDLPEERVFLESELPEVMLAVRVVALGELV